jgi:serine/threonine-protein kinase
MPANRYPTTQALIDDLMEFLAPRVPMNYSARLVLFLRDVGVLTDREADELLAAGAPRNVRRGSKDRTLLRHVSAVGGLLFAGLVGGGFAIQSAAGRFDEDSVDFTSGSDALSPARAGYLRVVVDPWAEVSIDGQRVATTPIARAIALSPGVHFVKLSNPYHREHQQRVRIRTGETELVEVELEPLHVLDEGAAP